MKRQTIVWPQTFVLSGAGVNGLKSMEKMVQAREQMLQELEEPGNVKQAQTVLLAFPTAPI